MAVTDYQCIRGMNDTGPWSGFGWNELLEEITNSSPSYELAQMPAFKLLISASIFFAVLCRDQQILPGHDVSSIQESLIAPIVRLN